MQNWQEYKKKLLLNPSIKQEYIKLEPEYKLAHELLTARLQQHLTQSELANKAGVKQEYIARLESGSAYPTVGNLNKVAGVLGKQLKLVETSR